MRQLRTLILAFFVALCGASFANAEPAHRRPDTLILISIDGFRADYLGRGRTPTLSALAADGAWAKTGMRPSFPSLTFPNHYALITGMRPDRNGIVSNTMEDRAIPTGPFKLGNEEATHNATWWNDATPLWETVQRQGLRAGTMFWPGSEANIHGVSPADFKPFDKKLSGDGRVDVVLDWLGRPTETRPDFVTLYFDIVDTAGHFHGPDSAEVNDAIASVDASVARLIAGLKARGLYEHTNIIIVADHGMASTPPDHMMVIDDKLDPKITHVVTYWAEAGIDVAAGHEDEVLAVLPKEHMQCYRREKLPARLHYGTHRRVPAIVCLAEPGWLMVTSAEMQKKHDRPMLGEHGYDPYDLQMRALFIAHGPAFRHGVTLEPFDNVDVYPLMAKVLGVRPEPSDGVLAEVAGALVSP